MAVQEISPQKMRDQMGFITNNTFLWKAYYSHGIILIVLFVFIKFFINFKKF